MDNTSRIIQIGLYIVKPYYHSLILLQPWTYIFLKYYVSLYTVVQMGFQQETGDDF